MTHQIATQLAKQRVLIQQKSSNGLLIESLVHLPGGFSGRLLRRLPVHLRPSRTCVLAAPRRVTALMLVVKAMVAQRQTSARILPDAGLLYAPKV